MRRHGPTGGPTIDNMFDDGATKPKRHLIAALNAVGVDTDGMNYRQLQRRFMEVREARLIEAGVRSQAQFVATLFRCKNGG